MNTKLFQKDFICTTDWTVEDLNTMLDPEVQAAMAKEIFNPPSNKLVRLAPPLSDQVMYGSRLQQVRWFDARYVNANRPIWVERIATEVVPKWRV